MARSLLGVLVLVTCVVPPPQPAAPAEEPPDGPKAIFNDDFIDHLAGQWKLARHVRGRDVENTVDGQWVLNHQFLQLHMKDAADPPAYEALVLIGYAHADREYIAHWCDTYGGKFSAIGHGKRSGDSIEFVFQYPEGPFYNTFTWDAKEAGWTFLMESQGEGGQRVLFAKDTLRRP